MGLRDGLSRTATQRLSTFQLKHRGPHSLPYKLGSHNTNMIDMILQDYKPLVYNNNDAQAPSDKRYAIEQSAKMVILLA
jgi:hypothetical protein